MIISNMIHVPVEISQMIASCLKWDRQLLFNPTLVCHELADVSTDVQWEFVFVGAFEKVGSFERKQSYASKVKYMCNRTTNQPELHERMEGLSFPLLSKLDLGLGYSPCRAQFIVHYLQSNLVVLGCHGITKEDIDKINILVPTRCPRLKKLSLKCAPATQETGGVMKLLSQLPCLKSLLVLRLESYLNLDPVEQHDNLRYLRALDCYFGPSWFRQLASLNAPVFPNLKEVGLGLSSVSVPLLSCIVGSVLRAITILIINTGFENVIGTLSKVTSLNTLTINFLHEQPKTIGPRDFNNLKQLKSLEVLHLRGKNLYVDELGDEHFVTFFAYLPRLREFIIDSHHINTVGIAMLIAMARFCPNVICCGINAIFDFRDLLQTPAPLFPRLAIMLLAGPLPEG
ncbi:hypothetical protein K470DRAFT_290547 [Piedraia hortae CBS 480.64]|uniref:F-box domain-containing protein n=1 Tax=Piedraia hortae CBS 480.64 TaxID=1314780 RepID=A0A6A7C8M7_9PEZI|nr:hypothetical protein K470DRAFT_290547 [Piedraia hortae CBS 480.64]